MVSVQKLTHHIKPPTHQPQHHHPSPKKNPKTNSNYVSDCRFEQEREHRTGCGQHCGNTAQFPAQHSQWQAAG